MLSLKEEKKTRHGRALFVILAFGGRVQGYLHELETLSKTTTKVRTFLCGGLSLWQFKIHFAYWGQSSGPMCSPGIHEVPVAPC